MALISRSLHDKKERIERKEERKKGRLLKEGRMAEKQKALHQLNQHTWESSIALLSASESVGLGSGKRNWERQSVNTAGEIPS